MSFSSSTIANSARKNQFCFKARDEKFNQVRIKEQNRNSIITSDQVRIVLAKKLELEQDL